MSNTNRPTHELFFIEQRPACPLVAAATGRKLAENAIDTLWHKAGVAFTTTRGNANIYVGKRGEPAAKRYFLSFSTAHAAGGDADRRIPVGDLFAPDGDSNIDFRADKVGVAFVNSDGSYTLVIGDRGDLEQVRYQLRPTMPRKPADKAPLPSEPAANDTPTPTPEASPAPVSRVIRRIAAAA